MARLKAADQWLKPDPAGGCSLEGVDLSSGALGLGEAPATAAGASDHADIDIAIVFRCTNASRLQFVDVQLFKFYPGIWAIDAQVLASKGQFKRRLDANSARLTWGK